MIGYIPSPPSNGISIGPLQLHFYGLLIAIAVLVAARLAQDRWAKIGGFAGTIVPIAFWAVIGGLIGARAYSLATSWQQDTGGQVSQAFAIWDGGLGIWGGVAGGFLAAWLKARRLRVPLAPLMDVVAPTLALAQAIGRWGNYFNQELFGLPSKLPWAVRITNQAQLANISPAKYRPALTAAGTFRPGTFQPTFLYESLWDLATFGLLLLVERKLRLRRGYLFAGYAALYTLGRLFTEYLRIDPAHRYLGLRLNDWTAALIFVVAALALVLRGRPRAGDELVGAPLPEATVAIETARAAKLGRPPRPGAHAFGAQPADDRGRGRGRNGPAPAHPLSPSGALPPLDALASPNAPASAGGDPPGRDGTEKPQDLGPQLAGPAADEAAMADAGQVPVRDSPLDEGGDRDALAT